MTYNWQQQDWRNFHYDGSVCTKLCEEIALKNSALGASLKVFSETVRIETVLETITLEALKTSAIEGENINPDEVMSSLRHQLGFAKNTIPIKDKRVEAISALMLAVRETYDQPLTQETLWHWHRLLMPSRTDIMVGAWRTHKDAMQIVSNASYLPRVHFEAPPSQRVPEEMTHFIAWFNQSDTPHLTLQETIIRAAIAHLYFESIHPFEDGNGRIGRAISEKALSQGLKHPIYISLSQAFFVHRKAYYLALETAQKSNHITDWIAYFSQMVLYAYEETEKLIDFTIQKKRFLEYYDSALDETHKKVIDRMLKQGHHGFAGGMNARKYMLIAGVSKATATRHLQYLAQIKAFMPIGDGRNRAYEISFIK